RDLLDEEEVAPAPGEGRGARAPPERAFSRRGNGSRMARRRSPESARRRLVRELAAEFGEHRLFIYATSIGFRALVALVPLALLALGLLGALGLEHTWHNSIAPEIKPHVTQPVFHAIDYSAEKVLSSGTAGLIVFSAALV